MTDHLDRRLRELHTSMGDQLDTLLDLDTGLSEVLTAVAHHRLGTTLERVLDLDAGLHTIVPRPEPDQVERKATGDIRGQLLPVYIVADESFSMTPHMHELNDGMMSLHEALLAEPMAAAKVRISILGFADDVVVRLELADLRREAELPLLVPRGRTNYGAVFTDLIQRIPHDVAAMKRDGYQVHRPAVFFFSDGQPTLDNWRVPHALLVDRNTLREAPNVIACGVGEARAQTILDVATKSEYAYVAIGGSDVGAAVAEFCTALTKSIVQSGRSLASGTPELVVNRPDGFRMAIDVI